MGLPFILQMMFANSIYTPACSWPLSSRNIAAHKHNKLMRKVATQIIEGKKKEIREEMGLEKGESNGTTREDFDGKKDIVHLLLRANMAKDLKENERMSDEEGEFAVLVDWSDLLDLTFSCPPPLFFRSLSARTDPFTSDSWS